MQTYHDIIVYILLHQSSPEMLGALAHADKGYSLIGSSQKPGNLAISDLFFCTAAGNRLFIDGYLS